MKFPPVSNINSVAVELVEVINTDSISNLSSQTGERGDNISVITNNGKINLHSEEIVNADPSNNLLLQLREENDNISTTASVGTIGSETDEIEDDIGVVEHQELQCFNCDNRDNFLVFVFFVLFLVVFVISVIKVYQNGYSVAIALFLSLSAFGVSVYSCRLFNFCSVAAI
ncbi:MULTISPECIES: hypothetical protein [Candidatus Ichthyocystis]|uniref:hypothetical protein n=1 Tax=Candidatus Ichthyocystis TaxID=2929841 RepID=UPI000B82FEAC|nr:MULTISPECIES: hypothetical protein [Ichthyocystis]